MLKKLLQWRGLFTLDLDLRQLLQPKPLHYKDHRDLLDQGLAVRSVQLNILIQYKKTTSALAVLNNVLFYQKLVYVKRRTIVAKIAVN